MDADATPTPPTAPPRERESEIVVRLTRDEATAIGHFFSYGATRGNHPDGSVGAPPPGPLSPYINAMGQAARKVYDATHAAASLPPSAGTINSSRTDSSLIDAPPSAETREPERSLTRYCEHCDKGYATIDTVCGFCGRPTTDLAGVRTSAPPAGSGETGRAYRELDEAMTMIDEQRGGIEGMRRNARIARQVIRALAAHPAGTTREEG